MSELQRQPMSLQEKYDLLFAEATKMADQLEMTHYALSKQRVWGGMEYVYNPIHPVHYRPVAQQIGECIESYQETMGWLQ